MLLWVVFLGLLLLCGGMSIVFLIYIFVVWFASIALPNPLTTKPLTNKGLSSAELERLPGVEEGGAVKGSECAVCLDEIEDGQMARVLPKCRHVFHRRCADAWLEANAVCPMCRDRLAPMLH